jgi:hypothetical protein
VLFFACLEGDNFGFVFEVLHLFRDDTLRVVWCSVKRIHSWVKDAKLILTSFYLDYRVQEPFFYFIAFERSSKVVSVLVKAYHSSVGVDKHSDHAAFLKVAI